MPSGEPLPLDRLRRVKKILLATLGALIALGSAVYVFLIHPLTSPSEGTPFAEAGQLERKQYAFTLKTAQ